MKDQLWNNATVTLPDDSVLQREEAHRHHFRKKRCLILSLSQIFE